MAAGNEKLLDCWCAGKCSYLHLTCLVCRIDCTQGATRVASYEAREDVVRKAVCHLEDSVLQRVMQHAADAVQEWDKDATYPLL